MEYGTGLELDIIILLMRQIKSEKKLSKTYWIPDTGFLMLDTRYWMLIVAKSIIQGDE